MSEIYGRICVYNIYKIHSLLFYAICQENGSIKLGKRVKIVENVM